MVQMNKINLISIALAGSVLLFWEAVVRMITFGQLH